MYLAEVRDGMTFAATTAIRFHLVDYVVHGWDVARSIGVPARFDDEALQAALKIALAVPQDSKSHDVHAPFRPAVPTTSASPLDRIVATLGRDPDWLPERYPGGEPAGPRPSQADLHGQVDL